MRLVFCKQYCLFLFVILVISGFQHCDIPVITSNPDEIPYRTEHFIIYYDDINFSKDQIEKIGLTKEKLLEHVNSYLNCTYNGTVEVFTNSTQEISYATIYERTHETIWYVITDNGHEIVHIVSIQEWGYTHWEFLIEGVAVAAQLRERGSAFDEYRNSIVKNSHTSLADTINLEINFLKTRLEYGVWDKTDHEYDLAGAFIHFLKVKYGIDKIKTWYKTGINQDIGIQPVSTFELIFEVSHTIEIELFKNALFTGNIE